MPQPNTLYRLPVRLIHSPGNCQLEWHDGYNLGRMLADQILVKTAYTGLCSSDVQQYVGDGTNTIPLGHFGHESVGQVIKVGTRVRNLFKEGDWVASRSDPAFANYFYSNQFDAVVVPEPSPKYILEPVACAINIVENRTGWTGHKILLVGTGFIANLVAQYLQAYYAGADLTVVGQHNVEQFQKIGLAPIADVFQVEGQKFDTVIELSGKSVNIGFVPSLVDSNGSLIYAASTNQNVILDKSSFNHLLWNNVAVAFPSPRSKWFHECMRKAKVLVENGTLQTEWAWTNGYPVEECRRAFAEAAERSSSMVRSYLIWPE